MRLAVDSNVDPKRFGEAMYRIAELLVNVMPRHKKVSLQKEFPDVFYIVEK